SPLAARSPQNFGSPVGEDFIDVHVGLRSRPRLPDAERELRRVAAVERFGGGGDDRLRHRWRGQTECGGYLRRSALDDEERANQLARQLFAGNTEIEERALCLRAPKLVRRNLDGAERIAFDARCRGRHCEAPMDSGFIVRQTIGKKKGRRGVPRICNCIDAYCAGVDSVGAGAEAGAAAGAPASSAAAFIDRRSRPLSSASSTLTRTTWPSFT